MFVTTPEIVWHNKEPIFSVDLHHSRGTLRIATAGADHTVKVSFSKINIGIYIYIYIYIYNYIYNYIYSLDMETSQRGS